MLSPPQMQHRDQNWPMTPVGNADTGIRKIICDSTGDGQGWLSQAGPAVRECNGSSRGVAGGRKAVGIHTRAPWLKVKRRTLQDLVVSIEACCGELLERAKTRVGGVSRGEELGSGIPIHAPDTGLARGELHRVVQVPGLVGDPVVCCLLRIQSDRGLLGGREDRRHHRHDFVGFHRSTSQVK